MTKPVHSNKTAMKKPTKSGIYFCIISTISTIALMLLTSLEIFLWLDTQGDIVNNEDASFLIITIFGVIFGLVGLVFTILDFILSIRFRRSGAGKFVVVLGIFAFIPSIIAVVLGLLVFLLFLILFIVTIGTISNMPFMEVMDKLELFVLTMYCVSTALTFTLCLVTWIKLRRVPIKNN